MACVTAATARARRRDGGTTGLGAALLDATSVRFGMVKRMVTLDGQSGDEHRSDEV